MILYKYYPCNEFTFRALSQLGIWCSPASNMNDPFDCLGDQMPDKETILGGVQSFLDKHENYTDSFSNEAALLFFYKARYRLIKEYSFCSFAEKPFNTLMWSYYANSHTGITLGIEFPSDIIANIRKVKYQDTINPSEDEVIKLRNLLKYFSEKSSERNTNKIEDHYQVILDWASIKTKDWSHENEYRFWSATRNFSGYLPYKPEHLKEVYFGLNCHEETKTLVRSILRGHGVGDGVYHQIKRKEYPSIGLTI